MILEPGAWLDPEELREAIRRANFTPSEVRVWVKGRLEGWELPSTAPRNAGLRSLALVTSAGGQRFVMAAVQGSAGAELLERLESIGSQTLILHGKAETLEGVPDVVLYVEGRADPGAE